MTDRQKVDIYKWLWSTEVSYKNRFTELQNNFMRSSEHSLADYFRLYEAEQQLKNFLKFGADLCIIMGNW